MKTRLFMKRLHLFLLIFLPFVRPGFSQMQEGSKLVQLLAPIEKKIDSLIEHKNIPSASIAVAKDGEIVWQKSFGWANKEEKVKATPQTIYALGSLSKSISATGLMTMVENNQLSLESSVNKNLGTAQLVSFVGDPDEVKVWHLLNMSAGIPHGWATYNQRKDTPHNQQEKDQFLQKIGIITFPPGKVFQYSNYSLGVVDLLIERKSGKPLERFMQEAVFGPLQMNHSFTQYHPEKKQDFASLYNSELALIDHYDFLPYGGGGFFSSAADLIQYGMFHLKNKLANQKQILSPATLDLMHYFDRGPIHLMGLGWFNTGHSLVSNGRISGAQSNLTLVPSENLAVVCLINASTSTYYADQTVDQIIDLIAPDLEKKMDAEKYAALFETPYESDEALLGNWKGQITTQEQVINLKMTFMPKGKVRIQVGDEAEKELERVIFSPSGKISTSVRSQIPVSGFKGDRDVFTLIELQLDQGKLIGHFAPMFSNDQGSFCFGAFAQLEKT